MTLPPLPEPGHRGPTGTGTYFDAFTADQLRDYARAAIAAYVPEAAFGNIAAVPAGLTDEQIIDLWAPMLADGVDRRPVGGRNKIVAFARAVLAAVPAQPGIRTLSSEQIERHTLTASECPPDSAVMLVSSINRLLGKSRGEGIRFAQPVAWMMTPNKQSHRLLMPSVQFEKPVVRADWELTPLYAAPQAVPVPEWQPIETAPKDRDVLVACSHGLYVARYCEHDIEWWHVDDNKHGPFPLRGSSPTHWQPLPAAPKDQPHE